MENLPLIAQITGLVFALVVGILLIISMMKDGKLTAIETAKVFIIGVFFYATIVNGTRDADTQAIFDTSTYLIMLGSLLVLAGIDIAKAKDIIKK